MVKIVCLLALMASMSLAQDIPLFIAQSKSGTRFLFEAHIYNKSIVNISIICANSFPTNLPLHRYFIESDAGFHYEVREFGDFEEVGHSFFKGVISKSAFSYLMRSKAIILNIQGKRLELDRESIVALNDAAKTLSPLLGNETKF